MVRIDFPEDEIQMNLYIHEDEIIDNFKDIKLDPSQEKN